MMKMRFAMAALAAMFACASVLADDDSIVVRVSGEGENRSEALENALRNAVRKVVGTYVVSQKTVANEDFEEDIYINADAVVTKHKELKKTEKNGVVTLEIEAEVVKNNLLKYVKKTQTTKIASTDTANLLVKRRALQNAGKTIDYIFKDYSQKMYLVRKSGDFEIAPSDDVESDNISFLVPYEVSFNLDEYAKIKKRLQNLLDKVAIATWTFTQEKFDEYYIREEFERYFKEAFNDSNQERGRGRRRRKGGFDSNQGYRIVSFCDDDKNGKYVYVAYVVPNQIYEKLREVLSKDSAIEFSFGRRHSDRRLKFFLKASLSFWFYRSFDYADYDHSPLVFRNWMCMVLSGYGGHYFTNRTYKKVWSMPEDAFAELESTKITAYSGPEAEFLLAKSSRRTYDMEKLAERGYVPAMISMVEDFGKDDDGWYPRAALLNSRHAQMKLGWKNSGLGFSIVARDGDYVVYGVQKGVPVKRDKVLKSINGTLTSPLSRYSQLSTLIGNIPAGETVHIEFANGKTVDVKAQD